MLKVGWEIQERLGCRGKFTVNFEVERKAKMDGSVGRFPVSAREAQGVVFSSTAYLSEKRNGSASEMSEINFENKWL